MIKFRKESESKLWKPDHFDFDREATLYEREYAGLSPGSRIRKQLNRALDRFADPKANPYFANRDADFH